MAAQNSGSIDVLDLTIPGERRKVQPNWAAINAQPLGSAGNPVRAFMPASEYAYLRDLLCADGLRPFYKGIGNSGAGPYTTIVDVFDVRCETASYRVYMDMYHPGMSRTAPCRVSCCGRCPRPSSSCLSSSFHRSSP